MTRHLSLQTPRDGVASSVSPSVFFVDKVEANERRARARERRRGTSDREPSSGYRCVEGRRARDVMTRERARMGVRDMTATGRYPPQPKFQPFAFYSAVRLGDPEQLRMIMETDPYFWTQDNGAGAPVHFATTC